MYAQSSQSISRFINAYVQNGGLIENVLTLLIALAPKS